MYTLRLREIRKSKKITQGELASMLGVSERVVGGWERGETGLPLDDACRCAAALGCTPNDLCGTMDETRDDGPPARDMDKARLDRAYSVLSDDAKRMLADFAESFACDPRRRENII